MVDGFTITKVLSSNLPHGEVYSIQLYVIQFFSDLSHVDGFLRVLRFPPPINKTETLFKAKHHKPKGKESSLSQRIHRLQFRSIYLTGLFTDVQLALHS